MESLFKRLLNNQHDIIGVLRGIDKVRQGIVETDYYHRNLTDIANFRTNQDTNKPDDMKK